MTLPLSQRWKALLGAWASTSLLFLSGLVVPVAGAVLLALTPQPGLALAARGRHRQLLGGMIALVTATAAATGGFSLALGYLTVFAVATWLLADAFRRGWSIEKSVGLVTAVQALVVGGSLLVFLASPSEAFVLLRTFLEGARDHWMEIYEGVGVQGENLELLSERTATFVDRIVMLGPALAIVGLGGLVVANVLAVRWRQRRSGQTPVFGDITTWAAPERFIWVLLASGYGVFAFDGLAGSVAANVFLVAGAVYFLHGLAILAFFADRWGVRGWVRGLALVLVLLEWFLAATVAVLGVFDLWRDFRRLHAEPDEFSESGE